MTLFVFSAGALSAIDMVLNNSSAAESFSKFPGLARTIFRSSVDGDQGSSVIYCVRWIKTATRLLAGGQYDSNNLSDVLKEAVGPYRRIFDVATAKSAGCRVAIITSRASDGKACVLANYRGTFPREANVAYEFLLPQSDRENPFLWEV